MLGATLRPGFRTCLIVRLRVSVHGCLGRGSHPVAAAHQRFIRGNPHKPSGELRFAAECPYCPVSLQTGFLHGVFRLRVVAQDGARSAVKRPMMNAHELQQLRSGIFDVSGRPIHGIPTIARKKNNAMRERLRVGNHPIAGNARTEKAKLRPPNQYATGQTGAVGIK